MNYACLCIRHNDPNDHKRTTAADWCCDQTHRFHLLFIIITYHTGKSMHWRRDRVCTFVLFFPCTDVSRTLLSMFHFHSSSESSSGIAGRRHRLHSMCGTIDTRILFIKCCYACGADGIHGIMQDALTQWRSDEPSHINIEIYERHPIHKSNDGILKRSGVIKRGKNDLVHFVGFSDSTSRCSDVRDIPLAVGHARIGHIKIKMFIKRTHTHILWPFLPLRIHSVREIRKKRRMTLTKTIRRIMPKKYGALMLNACRRVLIFDLIRNREPISQTKIIFIFCRPLRAIRLWPLINAYSSIGIMMSDVAAVVYVRCVYVCVDHHEHISRAVSDDRLVVIETRNIFTDEMP